MMKHLLLQYIDMKKEIEEIKVRIDNLNMKLDKINEAGNVKDAVRGGSGGWEMFHVEGYPVAEEDELRYLLSKQKRLLEQRKSDISDKLIEVEEFLNKMADSRMRRMITKRFIENKKWHQVAREMGENYTEYGCQKQMERFFESLSEMSD